jgi:hypothetical protein
MKRIPAELMLVALVLAGCGTPTSPSVVRQRIIPGPAEGELAPDISGVDLDGVAFNLSDYRGKVVMLDFWGTW